MIKKITTWIWLTILTIPTIMVFNDNYDTWYINIFGLLYCYLLYLNWNRLTTQWMRNYLDKFSEEVDEI